MILQQILVPILFADNTSFPIIVDIPFSTANKLNFELNKTENWAKTRLVSFSPDKTESMVIFKKVNKPLRPPLVIQDQVIQEVVVHKHLGLF